LLNETTRALDGIQTPHAWQAPHFDAQTCQQNTS